MDVDNNSFRHVMDSPYTASPLRRKSGIGRKLIPQKIIINDDEAELQARRKRRSEIQPSVNADGRQSLNLSHLPQFSPQQIQEQITLCIKLNTENKINFKNAFSLNAIDILTCLVKQKESNLQVASSSLDVSTKIYGLRVDSVYSEVLKMCGALDKQDKNNQELGESTNDGNSENQSEEGAHVKEKRKKRKKTNILSTNEALKGNVETLSVNALLCNEEDPQTSDHLYQSMAMLSVQDNCYMKNFCNPILDIIDNTLQNNASNERLFAISQPKLYENNEISPTFYFLDWSVDNEVLEESMEIDYDMNNDTFQFDLDASLPDNDTPFPATQDNDNTETQEINVNKLNRVGVKENIVDFRESIMCNTHNTTLEYSYVQPSEIIHFSGPSYWMVKRIKRSEGDQIKEKMKARIKRDIILDFNVDDDLDVKFKSSQNIKISTNIWNEEHVTYFNTDIDYEPNNIFNYFVKPRMNLMSKRKYQKKMEEPIINDIADDHHDDNDNDEENFAPMTDAIDLPDRDTEYHAMDTEPECNTQGVLTGENLIAAPDMVEDINIPYSKRAKKLDIWQVKKSMWKLLSKYEKENIENHTDVTEEVTKKEQYFHQVYKKLPLLLTKSNAEAMSVPIAFVSLLHLANEKTLYISSFADMTDLIIRQDLQS